MIVKTTALSIIGTKNKDLHKEISEYNGIMISKLINEWVYIRF